MTKQTKISTKAKWWIAFGAVAILIAAIILFTQYRGTTRLPAAASSVVDSSVASSGAPAMVILTSEAMVRAGIGVVPVTRKNFSSQISVVGILKIPDPAERVITAYARGRIEKMYVASTGAYVHKGEPLFEFYSPDILSAEKDYLIAAGISGMDKEMMAKNPGMEQHSNPELLRAARERLVLYGLTNAQIEQITQGHAVAGTVTITSTLNGIILQKLSQEGAYVEEGTSIYQLADLSSVWAEVDVPEAYIRFIRIGQVIKIHTDAYPNEEFTGRAIFISPVEEQASRTIRVRAVLPNPKGELRPGTMFTASIPISSGNALAIPQAAVIRTGAGDYVWTSDSNHLFTRHTVTLGMLSPDNYYQIMSGLSAGDEVASNGAFLIDAEHELTKSNSMASINMGPTGTKHSGEGTAIVRAINLSAAMITLDHSIVPGVMPAMTMAYKVSDLKFLQSVTVNESVRFTLTREDNGQYYITSIER